MAILLNLVKSSSGSAGCESSRFAKGVVVIGMLQESSRLCGSCSGSFIDQYCWHRDNLCCTNGT